MKSKLICLLFVGVFCFIATKRSQAVLLVRQAGADTINTGYGGNIWLGTTAAMNLATDNQVTKVVNFSNAAQVDAADALWIDIGATRSTLSAIEVANLTSFINSGRRLVMIGENHNWTTWNNSILSLVGGSYNRATFSGILTPRVENTLTAGVSSVYLPFGGIEAGLSTNGTQLFSQNFATLWSPNVVTILDFNIFNELYLPRKQNRQFMNNVVNWLTTPVPEPTSLLLTCSVLGIVGTSYRRRKA